jgi:2-polyprenyl-3-methyl-5-hydroxy-6-metoxy-1,4-benzoquinol methylase
MESSERLADSVKMHDQKASEWEQLYDTTFFRARSNVIISLLTPHLVKDSLWLDAGCGSGFFARVLAEHGCQVIGMDASPAMITTAGKLTRLRGFEGVFMRK